MQIQELNEEGGMGTVYLTRDLTIGRPLAIKLVNGDHDQTSRGRFGREARAAGGQRTLQRG